MSGNDGAQTNAVDSKTAPPTTATAAVTGITKQDIVPQNIADPYAVKVKSQYVLSERPSCLAPPVEPPPRSDSNNNNGNNGNKSKRSKNNRGQNKKRPRDAKVAYAEKACLAVVRGEVCPFINSERGCRYNHDLKEMLANRPPDICDGEDGASWLKDGCPFGK